MGGEAAIGEVSSGSVMGLDDEMRWGQQYRERQARPEATLTQRLVACEMMPIPAKALGVVLLRAVNFAADVVGSIREGM